jgi:hypothetical protein
MIGPPRIGDCVDNVEPQAAEILRARRHVLDHRLAVVLDLPRHGVPRNLEP